MVGVVKYLTLYRPEGSRWELKVSLSLFFFFLLCFLMLFMSLFYARYMTDVFPLMNGAPEALETAMALVIKRVLKIFEKLVNKPDLMVCTPRN